jgi:cardiolipin synthase (CMP-forming)
MRHIPNLICLLRLALIWPIVTALAARHYPQAFALFAIAAVSDGLDGYLAKRFGWTSELGKFLDPFADKLLLVAVFVVGAWTQLVPQWLAAAAIARDVVIGFGALIFFCWFGPLHGRATVVSKINTLFQLCYLLIAMIHVTWLQLPQPLLKVLAGVTFLTTVLSGWDYMRIFMRRAWATAAAADCAGS